MAARKTINLALQGGGAHGAFTWGVLDALAEDERLRIEAFTTASAGTMNAAAFIDGWAEGGADGAKAELERFWRSVSFDSGWNEAQRHVLGGLLGPWAGGPASLIGLWADWWQQVASPYEFNPLDINPLRDVLESLIDFPRLRANDEFRFFVSATNVETGKIRVFERHEIDAAHLMASACLPTVFRAVEIDGAAYWDGGYMGNPALYPLFYGGGCDDVLLVQINPVERRGIPRTRHEIERRLNEITFNATLLRELRAIEFVIRLREQGQLPPERYKAVRMHRIDAGSALMDAAVGSKEDTGWESLLALKAHGRRTAQRWLARHFKDIGERATFDLRAAFE